MAETPTRVPAPSPEPAWKRAVRRGRPPEEPEQLDLGDGGDGEEPTLLRKVSIAGGVLAATVVLGAVIGTILAGGSGGGSNDGGPSAISSLRPINTGELIPASKAKPEKLKEPKGIGARNAGVALLALSQVQSVKTDEGTRRAPVGSRMFAFTVGNWACEEAPCDPWQTLDPQLSIDGDLTPLESDVSTYVVVVPPGTDQVSLTVEADEFTQSIGMVGEDDTVRGISLFEKRDQTKVVPVRKQFPLTEQTSVQLTGADGQLTNTFVRNVVVGDAQRRFFLFDTTPKSPDDAFLSITLAYSYAGQQQTAFDPAEVSFRARGQVYAARDLDPSPTVSLLGFEIPADISSGYLVFGGTVEKTSTTGVPYTTTLQDHRLKVSLVPRGD